MAVVVVGVYTLDLYMFVERLPAPGETVNSREFAEAHGGKGANQAVAARRLGAAVALLAQLGDDPVGAKALRLFQAEGLDLSGLTVEPGGRTGASFITVDPGGVQLIANYAGVGYRLRPTQVRAAQPLLQAASVLLLQGEIAPEVSLEAMRLAGPTTTIVLDPSPVEAFPDRSVFARAHILTPNQQEAAALTGLAQPCARDVAAASAAPVVLLTRGGAGVEIYDHGETYLMTAPTVEQVVDTTGAGDAFNGALAAGLDRGLTLREAVGLACRYSARSVTRRYCIASYPRWDEFNGKGERLE